MNKPEPNFEPRPFSVSVCGSSPDDILHMQRSRVINIRDWLVKCNMCSPLFIGFRCGYREKPKVPGAHFAREGFPSARLSVLGLRENQATMNP